MNDRHTTRHTSEYSPKEEKTTKSATQIAVRGGEGLTAAAAFFVAKAGPIVEVRALSDTCDLAAQH